MTTKPWFVVKVGGSLFDLPDLRGRLRGVLASFDDMAILVVPGGGPAADAIRALDRTHQLGEEASHWLALQALSLNARFLKEILPEASLSLACAAGSEIAILDAYPFFQADEARHDHLPHVWQVTSDSLAVRAATVVRARELILLKSVAWDNNDWDAASRAGIVDDYFPTAIRAADAGLKVRIVNLRDGQTPSDLNHGGHGEHGDE